MTKENTLDLLVTKFYSSPKDRQHKLLSFCLDNAPDKNKLIDFLNGKNLYNEDKDFYEKDFIYVPLSVTCYPGPYKKYYEENLLIVNDLYIRVQVNHINPITGYTGLILVTGSNEKEEVVDVYSSYIPNQKEIKIM